MRYLILSDLHANVQALDAVLSDAASREYGHILILGDIVGYGGDPEAVLDRVRALSPTTVIRGNHDAVCAGLHSAELFNDAARDAILWTRDTLPRESLAWLRGLPQGPITVEHDIEICHGAPFDEDFYVFSAGDATRALASASAAICLFGHTHRAAAFAARGGYAAALPLDENDDGWATTVEPGMRVLINVGSVGQPRDGNPRAAYGLLDTETRVVESRRVDYDIAGAQRRIRDAGLPAQLARRLERGV